MFSVTRNLNELNCRDKQKGHGYKRGSTGFRTKPEQHRATEQWAKLLCEMRAVEILRGGGGKKSDSALLPQSF